MNPRPDIEPQAVQVQQVAVDLAERSERDADVNVWKESLAQADLLPVSKDGYVSAEVDGETRQIAYPGVN